MRNFRVKYHSMEAKMNRNNSVIMILDNNKKKIYNFK